MAAVVLDSEAVSALARPHRDPERHLLLRSYLRMADEDGWPVRIPSAALVELYRGGGTDAAIDSLLEREPVTVLTTGARVARTAGHLLAAAGAGSELAVDALVVATARRLGGGLVITHDPADIGRLAENAPNVRVITI